MSPPGYHVMLALIVGALVVSPFSENRFILLGTYVLAVLCTLALVQYYKRRKGMWINGNSDRPAKKNASTAGLIAGGGFAASFAL